MYQKNENECYVDGKKYIAVSNDDIDKSCCGCAGSNNDGLCAELYLCTSMARQDKRQIVWVDFVCQ
jgi:hypothetical protein